MSRQPTPNFHRMCPAVFAPWGSAFSPERSHLLWRSMMRDGRWATIPGANCWCRRVACVFLLERPSLSFGGQSLCPKKQNSTPHSCEPPNRQKGGRKYHGGPRRTLFPVHSPPLARMAPHCVHATSVNQTYKRMGAIRGHQHTFAVIIVCLFAETSVHA